MRLQAFLARAGAAPSRRKAEAVISAGRVRINGHTAELGAKVSEGDVIYLDGQVVTLPETHTYLALNKPAGYLTTMKDDFGRPTVADLMPENIPGLVPVGRLDAQTTGLILLTNDGDFANYIAHPATEIEKEYELTVAASPPKGAFEALAKGPTLDDGPMHPPCLTKPEKKGKNLKFKMTIHEGRNRIIRRACEEVGLDLISLTRLRIGSVSLGKLPEGRLRRLRPDEIPAAASEGSHVRR